MVGEDGRDATINLILSRDAGAVRVARGAVMRLLGDEPPVAFVRDAVLLTSELMSNAVLHGSGFCELAAVFRSSDGLRVEVCDDSPAMPVMAEATDTRPGDGGLGLRVVDAVATSWGAVERLGGGKRVWFELSIERWQAD